MLRHAFTKKTLQHLIVYFSWLCVVFVAEVPPKLFADCCSSSVLVEAEDDRRTRTAMFVTGATVIALVGGIAYAALGSSCHKRHHSSYCYSPYSSCSYDGSHSNSHGSNYSSYSHRHHHHNDSYSYSSYLYSPSHAYSHNPHSIFRKNHASSFSGGGKNYNPEPIEGRDFPLSAKKTARIKHSKEADQLSGIIMTHPTLASSTQGNVTAFVRLPDGTTQMLGTLPYSTHSGSSLTYGPFSQKGTYVFGISLDGEANCLKAEKVGSIEIHLNESTVEHYDFCIPSHAPIHYEPRPYEYTLR